MWRLIVKRFSARRDLAKDQALIRRLGRAIRASLKTERKRRVEDVGEEGEALFGSDSPLQREACHRIKRWYKDAFDRAPPPAWVTLDRITAERVELYSYVPPPRTNIPISGQPFPVDDSVPTDYNIEWAVTRLRNHCSGGTSGMRAEHLKRWLATAQKSEKEKDGKEAATTTERAGMTDNGKTSAEQAETEADNWKMVVDLVQSKFREEKLEEEATWQAVVLIPNGKTDYRGIALVEVMWKVVAAILNCRLMASITFHNFLHGFRAGRGTGTATLEAKLLQQLAALREEVL